MAVAKPHRHGDSSFCRVIILRGTTVVRNSIKVKVPLDIFSPVVSNFRGRCSSRFQAVEPVLVRRRFHCHVASVTRERCFNFPLRWYLFIYSHLHAFKLLGWQGAGTKRRELTPSHGFDLTTAGLLTLQHTKASAVQPAVPPRPYEYE